MSKIKVLYIHHGRGIGGAPLSLLFLVKALDKNKYDPVVLFLQNSEAIDLYKTAGIKIIGPLNILDFSHTKINWYKWYHLHIFIKAFWDSVKTFLYIANKYFNEIKPDFIHLNTSSLWVWAIVAKKQKIPIVFHIREPLADGYFGFRKKFITKVVEKYATTIMPICYNDSKPWINSNKVNIVYNAVDKTVFNSDLSQDSIKINFNFSKNSPKILYLGGLSKEKGALEIIKIFKKVLKLTPDAELLIAGYVDLKTHAILNLKRYFPTDRYKISIKKELNNLKQVYFLDACKNISQIMNLVDIVVFPATVGHFARPIIEAGFLKKPVVASNLSPLNELVLDGKTGFLVDIKDLDKWADKIALLLQDKFLNSLMGQNAYQFCSQKFDLVDQIKKVENIYKQIKF